MRIGVAGGGVAGSLVAWRAAALGADVEVFDAGCDRRCSFVAAGMLSPVAELVTSSPRIEELGMESIPLWHAWLGALGQGEAIKTQGSLLVAHHRDTGELDRIHSAITAKTKGGENRIVSLDCDGIADLEPALGHIQRGYLMPDEGCLDTAQVMETLRQGCDDTGVTWHDGAQVDAVEGGTLSADGKAHGYDWACDCRGLGAADDLPLRAVRGEIIHLQSDDVDLTRPVRVAHPRLPVYLVPRGDGRLLVGATEIETSDDSCLSVRSTLELLGTAYGLIPELAEARVVETKVGLRPALPDNEPICAAQDGKVAINGMYRHGFLVAPALVEQAIGAMGLN